MAIVPPKFVRQIEQARSRPQVRSERMEQWKGLKHETALTEQTFEALRWCFSARHDPGVGVESDRG